jgi:hypothetical protein
MTLESWLGCVLAVGILGAVVMTLNALRQEATPEKD